MKTPRSTHRLLCLCVSLLVGIATVALASGPASAHDDVAGTLTLEAATSVGSLSYDLEVRLIYTADGHGVADATVTVVADRGDATMTPVTMQPGAEDGLYTARVVFDAPGQWTLRFTAVTPPATLEHAISVAGGDDETPTPTNATAAPPETRVPTTGTGNESSDDSNASDSAGALLILVAGVVIVAVTSGLIIMRRRRR